MNIHKPTRKSGLIASGLAVVAVTGAVAGAALSGSNQPPAAGPANRAPVTRDDANVDQTHDQTVSQTDGVPRLGTGPWQLGEIRQPTLSRDRSPGGSQIKGTQINGRQHLGADEATQVHMSITNSTNETLKLTSASDSGGSVHWQGRATDLAPGENETVNVYAATDAQINLGYTGATSGAMFQLMGKTPTVGSNEASGSSSTTSYTVQTSAGSGYNPTDKYTIQPGQTFDYSGQTATYVVPPGVTQLAVTARGGAGAGENSSSYYNGAQVNGTMTVTPGEVLTLGVGGQGQCASNNVEGGWGLTSGSATYRGGNGTESPMGAACSGGGATVILDPNGNVLLVAGGGGGEGSGGSGARGHAGGLGGANGVWLGGNGAPWPGGGGQAGTNSTSQGQDATGAGELAGGAGGGGADGGLAGLSGGGAGGGAGGSVANGLTGSAVSTAPSQTGNPSPSWVIFSPVS